MNMSITKKTCDKQTACATQQSNFHRPGRVRDQWDARRGRASQGFEFVPKLNLPLLNLLKILGKINRKHKLAAWKRTKEIDEWCLEWPVCGERVSDRETERATLKHLSTLYDPLIL